MQQTLDMDASHCHYPKTLTHTADIIC